MTFPSTHPALARALAARDYAVPTAVQLAVLEANAASRDLLVSAQTGSGKTIAFGLAVATTLLGSDERFFEAEAPMALIIAPTRELAMQVQRELSWLYAETGARVVTCVGGMDARAEARQLHAGAHIVVGTPGRLRDHLERKRLDLSQLKCIVLDEADEMLDLGFREDLQFILDATPEGRQSLLFSATMPRAIEALARRYQRDAVRIETTSRNTQHADIDYQAIRVVQQDIENAVVNVLRYHEMRAALVFCATREAVKRLQARLQERGFSAVALSGELTQAERTRALQSIRDGRARVLVATDVAARGLDLPELTLVLHADLPNDSETLLHRSGRTGRAGRKGTCVLVVPFNRRRKAELLLSAARINAAWIEAPGVDDIRARDHERFLADAIFTEAASDDDIEMARRLQAERSAEEIALALVRLNRARLPAPEELSADPGPPPRSYDPMRSGYERRNDRGDRGDRVERSPRAAERGARTPRRPREDNRDMVWFRLSIGRERNADPRWLVPLICKAGNVTKAEIGQIKIYDRDTRFQIVADRADEFSRSMRAQKNKEGHFSSDSGGSDDAQHSRQTVNVLAPRTDAAPLRAAKKYAPKSHEPKAYPAKNGSDKTGKDRTASAKPWAGKGGAGKTGAGKPASHDRKAPQANEGKEPSKSPKAGPLDAKPRDFKVRDRKPGDGGSRDAKPSAARRDETPSVDNSKFKPGKRTSRKVAGAVDPSKRPTGRAPFKAGPGKSGPGKGRPGTRTAGKSPAKPGQKKKFRPA